MSRSVSYLPDSVTAFQVLTWLLEGQSPVEIEKREGISGRTPIVSWLSREYGLSAKQIIERIRRNELGFTRGKVRYASGSSENRHLLAVVLEGEFMRDRRIALPRGEYHMWVFEGLICVGCSTNYGRGKKPYRRIYQTSRDIEEFSDIRIRKIVPKWTEYQATPEDIASQFGIIYLPEEESE